MHALPAPAATPLYDTARLREAETRAVAVVGGDGFALMQRAGAAAWRHLLDHWPGAGRIVVACGPGNNGGDGYVLALQALRSGRQAQVVHAAGHGPRSLLAGRAHAAFVEAGGLVVDAGERLPEGDVVVDAVFGLGFQGVPDGAAAGLLAAIAASGRDVFSLDVPSGVDPSCGHVPGPAVTATRTLQFIASHAGLATGAALEHVGSVDVDGLDLPAEILADTPVTAWKLRARSLGALLPVRRRNAHKGDSGHVLLLGGNHGMGGAVILAAEAVLRAGAGLASLGTRPGHVAAVLARRPEVMAHGVEDPVETGRLLAACDVCAIGPGLGRDAWAQGLLRAAFHAGKPLVVDADGLNLLANSPRRLPEGSVLTPHPGEAARLLGCPVDEVQRDRLRCARMLAARHDCAVVLKGAGSVIATAIGPAWVIDAGNPGMAVAGMGDALTGIIAALLAQGLPAERAAAAGALWHAVAGDRAATEGGRRGLLPSDLVDALRQAGPA